MSEEKGPKFDRSEPEHKGPAWTHPYALYAFITLGLFLFLLFMGYLGLKNGWIPKR